VFLQTSSLYLLVLHESTNKHISTADRWPLKPTALPETNQPPTHPLSDKARLAGFSRIRAYPEALASVCRIRRGRGRGNGIQQRWGRGEGEGAKNSNWSTTSHPRPTHSQMHEAHNTAYSYCVFPGVFPAIRRAGHDCVFHTIFSVSGHLQPLR
jgi:hypothetical protein